MKQIKNLTLLVLFVLASVGGVYAQSTDIISAKDFKKAMKSNKNLVIIDASKTKKYKENHVKGAMHILYGDLNKDKSVAPLGTIQTPEFIGDYLGKKGISADDEIIIYQTI